MPIQNFIYNLEVQFDMNKTCMFQLCSMVLKLLKSTNIFEELQRNAKTSNELKISTGIFFFFFAILARRITTNKFQYFIAEKRGNL